MDKILFDIKNRAIEVSYIHKGIVYFIPINRKEMNHLNEIEFLSKYSRIACSPARNELQIALVYPLCLINAKDTIRGIVHRIDGPAIFSHSEKYWVYMGKFSKNQDEWFSKLSDKEKEIACWNL